MSYFAHTHEHRHYFDAKERWHEHRHIHRDDQPTANNAKHVHQHDAAYDITPGRSAPVGAGFPCSGINPPDGGPCPHRNCAAKLRVR